jgi:hypothetical protein
MPGSWLLQSRRGVAVVLGIRLDPHLFSPVAFKHAHSFRPKVEEL